jgi:triphosphatase
MSSLMQTELKRKPASGRARALREAESRSVVILHKPVRAAGRGSLTPVHAKEPRLKPGQTAARAFQAIAEAALAQVAANAQVLQRARRLEALHQLRVGLRRLRGAISLFAPMLADAELEAVKTELKWLTRQLNDARNLDVFIKDSYRPAARRHRDWPGMVALGKALLAAQTRAYDQAQAAVGSERFAALMQTTARWTRAGDWSVDPDPKLVALRTRPIRKLAPELLGHSHRSVLKRGRNLEKLEPEARHKLRLHAKRLRYATAFFSGLYGDKGHKRFSGAMHGLTGALGEQTDIATAAELTAELAKAGRESVLWPGENGPLAAYAAARVAIERAEGEAKAMTAAAKAFKRFQRAEPFW